ncbi:PQQ-dependent sugar dehydrogenase [Chitinophaga polysaccharea]|uniref:PQQ-dependent sugar dehydrogenase n=1 Tax=Chitinophaga polysaccharea TaxID=1293035 RepID=UPI001159897A|nr:sorbosone dehydrogenase family protein [Chitinophaga polysaccharea]
MEKILLSATFALVLAALYGCNGSGKKAAHPPLDSLEMTNNTPPDSLPLPGATPSVTNFSNVIGWDGDARPIAPPGFVVTKFADGLKNPRWIFVAPNGDVFVSEAHAIKRFTQELINAVSGKAKSENNSITANRITMFRDTNNDGHPDERYTFMKNLNQPMGMLVLNDKFYVANTDGLMQYPYQPGMTSIKAEGKKILPLPAGGYNNHWARNIIASEDGTKLYVSVGSGTNAAEHGMENEKNRAAILEVNPDGSNMRIYASGLRNPVGMDWATGTHTLWTVVNERDQLGDDLVPDYFTSVKDGGFYGWPYSYFGQHEDPAFKGQATELVKTAIVPDLPLIAHTASLGLVFYKGNMFPEKYRNGAFIGQHGSWNRTHLAGYKVIYIPFKDGKPAGEAEDFLTGFIADEGKSEVHGRPVGVSVAKDGALLVADDAGNSIWRISVKK